MTTKSTIAGVQFLRGLAAVLVVFGHLASMMAFPEHFGRAPANIYLNGHIGVPIFFVISGFIIALVSLDERLRRQLSPANFALRRFCRIVPFLWVCVLLYAAVRLLGTGKSDFLPTVRALFIWPIGELRPNVVWTLRHEMLFYALFCVAMLLDKRRPWILGLWFVAPLLVGMLPDSIKGSPWVQMVASPFNLYFGIGFLLGCAHLLKVRLLHLSIPGGFPAAALASSVLLAAASAFPDETSPSRLACFVIACGMLVWFGINLRDSGGPWSRLGKFLGDASYAIYLVHNIFLLILLKMFAAPTASGNLLWIHAAMAVTALMGGAAVHLWVERPLVRASQSYLMPRKTHAQTPA